MFFYLHYVLLTSGLSGTSVLLAVYFKTYSDASQGETGALLMAIPFVNLFIKPIFCSMADRQQSHRLSLMLALVVMMIGFAPFLVVPLFPDFYEQYPRYSWYVQAVACLVGSSGLGVAWSLGDCLAVNHSQRTGVPFGRMRFMGTLSWGIYGFIIGQINEHPSLPKYMPAFIILHLSVALELLLLVFWDRKSFEMVDPLAVQTPGLGSDDKQQQAAAGPGQAHLANNGAANLANMPRDNNDQQDRELDTIKLRNKQMDLLTDSVPSSLGGTIKIKPEAAKALFEAFATNDEELIRRLNAVEQQQRANESNNKEGECRPALHGRQIASTGGDKTDQAEKGLGPVLVTRRNPQLVLLKMILLEDGRVLKYIVLFTAFGAFVAPINFFFVSIESLCHERGYNFSQVAGAVLMSQAGIETLAFIVAPYLLNYLTRWSLLSSGLVIMSMKYVFYSGWYYDEGVSPYWAVLAEWSHGIPYGIFCTILADVSLMFANQSRLFIPELRRMGFITADTRDCNKETIEAEERSIKMALRATMQALFSGFMDGLGVGVGALLCGVFSDLYSYHIVWQIFALLTVSVFAIHLLVEVSKSRWSDAYKPSKGTKAFEIMELSRETTEAQRQRFHETRKAKGSKQLSVGNDGAAPPM